jgi:secreted Zn-dependent insulinase-like peptidase
MFEKNYTNTEVYRYLVGKWAGIPTMAVMPIYCGKKEIERNHLKKSPKELSNMAEVLKQPIIQSENDKREYRFLTLGNMMQVILVSDPETEKSAACCDVNVGSFHDPAEGQGLAHFLEHMLFMGTETYPDENAYTAFLNSHGGSSNAYTDDENTVYYFDIQPAHFEGALDLFASFFICPLFSESGVMREINAVDSENSKNLQVWRQHFFLFLFCNVFLYFQLILE